MSFCTKIILASGFQSFLKKRKFGAEEISQAADSRNSSLKRWEAFPAAVICQWAVRVPDGGVTPHDHPTPAARCLKFLVPVGPYIRLECNPILNVKHIQEHQGTPSIVWKYRAVKCGFFNTAASE